MNTGSVNFFWKNVHALNEHMMRHVRLMIGMTNNVVIVTHSLKPNESSSSSKDVKSTPEERFVAFSNIFYLKNFLFFKWIFDFDLETKIIQHKKWIINFWAIIKLFYNLKNSKNVKKYLIHRRKQCELILKIKIF